MVNSVHLEKLKNAAFDLDWPTETNKDLVEVYVNSTGCHTEKVNKKLGCHIVTYTRDNLSKRFKKSHAQGPVWKEVRAKTHTILHHKLENEVKPDCDLEVRLEVTGVAGPAIRGLTGTMPTGNTEFKELKMVLLSTKG